MKIKVIDGIPCIVLSEESEEHKKEHESEPERFSVLNDFTRIQRSKENNCLKDLMRDLKEKFKNKQK